MKNLSLISLLIISNLTIGQKENKYTRANKSAAIYNYSADFSHSRSLLINDNKVYIGNSNGSLFVFNLSNNTTSDLMKGRNFEEMRDIALVNSKILGMQSGKSGLLALMDTTKFIKFCYPQKKDEWIGVFLNGMDFHKKTGFIMGDPINGFFKTYYTTDAGEIWKPCEGKIAACNGEIGFAASGTNVQVLNDSTFIFASGGGKSRLHITTDQGKSWKSSEIPFLVGSASGAFSIYFKDINNGVVVGGDYENPMMSKNNCYFTSDGGKFWVNPKEQVHGYRSCVIEKDGTLYACGTTGIDYSTDFGNTWHPFAYGNYFSMATNATHLFATMPKGNFQQFELIKK